MRVIIALFLAIFGVVSSNKRFLRIVTWNVEKYENVPSNLNHLFGDKRKLDAVFLAIQGVNETGYSHWEEGVKMTFEAKSLQLYHSYFYNNVSHFMGYHKKHHTDFSDTQLIDYYDFDDEKNTSMIALNFAWHRLNFTIIHGREPSTDDEYLQTKHYKSFNEIFVRIGYFDFFFIAGEISYLLDSISKSCWRMSQPDESPNKIVYKSHKDVQLLSYTILNGFDSEPLMVDYKIDIDTREAPLKNLPFGRLT